MRVRFNTFTTKLILLAILASMLSSGTIVATLFCIDRISSLANLKNQLSTLADVIGQNSVAALEFNDPTAAKDVLQALRAEPPVMTACLYDLDAGLFAEYHRDKNDPLCPRREGNMAVARHATELNRSITHGFEKKGTIYLKADHQALDQRWMRLFAVSISLLILSIVLGGIAGFIFQRGLNRAIVALTRAMQTVTTRKDFDTRVNPSGTREIARLGVGFNVMVEELKQREQEKAKFEAQLAHQALYDELTGLPNRRLFTQQLLKALEQASLANRQLAMLFIDLDGFKLVNDSLGHIVGDMLLAKVAARLQAQVSEKHIIARLGGDEFAVVVVDPPNDQEVEQLARNLVASVEEPFFMEDNKVSISASIGISSYPEQGTTSIELLQNSDAAMCAAKRNGKNSFARYTTTLGVSVRERVSLEQELRAAIDQGGISVFYQPEFDTTSMRVVRFEALARWAHPTLGMIPPSKFIPIAEQSGLIVPLGAYVMERACAKAVELQREMQHPMQIAVNVSSIQFGRSTFVDEVMDTLRRTGLAPHLLQLELTESVMLSGTEFVADSMRKLSLLGVEFAIDDFGTGYSSLGYLHNLPFDALKVDRSFVLELGEKPESEAIMKSLVILAHGLRMRVIVEGVETPEQLEMISHLGGDEVQGYLLCRPVADANAFLKTHGISTEAPSMHGEPSNRSSSLIGSEPMCLTSMGAPLPLVANSATS